ncbi:MAG: hypothetical protein ACLFN8_03960 [Candidatus Woesearchaeota archaeon]
MAEFMILPPLIFGVLLGLLELYFLSVDESGMHWLQHGLHAMPVMFIFTFVSFNISYVFHLINFADNFAIDLGARVAIGLLAMIKIKAAASITGKGGVGESWTHVLIIAGLLIAGPYIWEYVLADLVGQYLPF